jgi:hypothetical protein
MNRDRFDRDFNFVSTMVKVIFAFVFILIIAQIGFAIWLGVGAVDAIQNGTGLKEIVETVWCGSDNGQGVDCVKE